MNGETIKQFLIGLSFGIDEAALSKFNKALSSATLKVTALAVSVKVAAAGIFYGISKISDSFEQLGYELRLIAPPVTKMLQLRQELMKAYRAAGVDLKVAAQQAVLFNFSLTKTKYVLEALVKGTALRFLPMLTKQMDIFRGKIYANLPKIQDSLERFVRFLFKAFEAVTILGGRVFSILGRVYDFFKKLHDLTNGLSTVVLAVVAAWKVLNLAFLASPLGIILVGLTALLALYDDFMTYKEGGESLFDWGKIMPAINSAIAVFKSFFEVVMAVAGAFQAVYRAIANIFDLNFSGLVDSLKPIADAIFNIGDKIKDYFMSFSGLNQSVSGLFSGIANSGIGSLFNSGADKNLGAMNNPQPIGVDQAKSNQTNQKISQETSIVVQGSADAGATGKAVASEQAKVNFDMARNMKGATR